MEDNEMTEPTRPNLPEGYRWADELAKEALDGIGADDKTMAYEAAEHLAENIEDPYPQGAISEIADSYVNCYKAMRRKWLLADEDHLEAFENAIQEGLVDMNGFDLDTAIGVGWCQYNEDLLNSHAETINHAALYLSLSELVGGKTYFALSPKVIEAVEQMPFDDDFDNLLPLSEDLAEQMEEMQVASGDQPLAISITQLWRDEMLLDGRMPEIGWHEAERGYCQQLALAEYAKEHGFVHDEKGSWYHADAMVQMMDDGLREELHSTLAGEVTEQGFIERYAFHHAKRFGEAWQPDNGVTFNGTERGLRAFEEKQAEAASFDAALDDAQARAADQNAMSDLDDARTSRAAER